MASHKEYLQYILDQLADAEITYRPMMGEYLLYCRGRLFGGIYDDRLLVKPVPAAGELLPDAGEELPYEGAKPMLPVEDTDDRAFLTKLVNAMWQQLPPPKKKK